MPTWAMMVPLQFVSNRHPGDHGGTPVLSVINSEDKVPNGDLPWWISFAPNADSSMALAALSPLFPFFENGSVGVFLVGLPLALPRPLPQNGFQMLSMIPP